jgi:hypothetical protein
VIRVYQFLAHGRWFSPGTPASSTTKIGRHDIAEILLKVALSTKNHQIYESKWIKNAFHLFLNKIKNKRYHTIGTPLSTNS